MKKVLAWSLASIFALSAAANCETQEALNTHIEKLIQHDAIHSVSLRVFELGGCNYSGAAGQARADSDRPMTPQTPYFIASITKTMVAVVTLQLVEGGALRLDSTLSELKIFDDSLLFALHNMGKQSFGPNITIQQLLSHRTGLRDYLLDDPTGLGRDFETGFAPGSLAGLWSNEISAFFECEANNCSTTDMAKLLPGRPWQPWDKTAGLNDNNTGMLNFYASQIAGEGLAIPGEGAHYSDTNYLLLGIIVQEITGKSLGTILDESLFTPLNMQDSYLGHEASDELLSKTSDFYAAGLNMVSSGIDFSWDWGGGGVVSTSDDLLIFMRALVAGELFKKQATLDTMTNFLATTESNGEMQVGYGLGLRYAKTPFGPMWSHSGAWGAEMAYFPDQQIFIMGTVNVQGAPGNKMLIEPVMDLLRPK